MTNHSLHIQLKEKQQKLTLLQSQIGSMVMEVKNIQKCIKSNGIIKNCKFCDVEFVTTDKRKIYCNFECSKKISQEKNKKVQIKQEYCKCCNAIVVTMSRQQKNCKHCDREFVTGHKSKIYCDMTCAKKAYKEVVYARKRSITRLKKLNNRLCKNCKHCNKEFIVTHKVKEYCNLVCQQTANAKRMYAKKKEIMRIKKLNNMLYKNCKHCNRKFQTALELKTYCDTTCQQAANAKRKCAKKKGLYNILKQVLDK